MGISNADYVVFGTFVPIKQSHSYCSSQHQHPSDDTILLYGSYVTGCKVLGDPVNLHLNELSFENVKSVIEQYLIGSVIFAVVCSILAGTIAFILLTACRKKRYDPVFYRTI